ncbi:MAG: radical SAM protein [Candidatus Omnitrophica bacterium]|nr:radical SAM protein [Candidatus Omnitrophota bacterium]
MITDAKNIKTLQAPKTCLLTVSNTCHLKCHMCDLWKKDTRDEEMSIDDAKRFIAALQEFGGGPIELHLIGGETFVKEGIFDLITLARKNGARVVVTTSAYSITREVAKKIVQSGLNMINFSLESLNADTHDCLRGVLGVHEKVINAIQYVAEESTSIEMAINTIITKQNIHDLIPLVEWVNSHERLSQIYFMAVMRPFGSDLDVDWYDTERATALWPDDSITINNVLDRLIEMKQDGAKIGNSAGQLRTFKSYFENPTNVIKQQGCRLGDDALNINAIGDAYLCFFMEKLGNIQKQSPCEMWFSEKAHQIRKNMRQCNRNCELIINCYYKDEQ